MSNLHLNNVLLFPGAQRVREQAETCVAPLEETP